MAAGAAAGGFRLPARRRSNRTRPPADDGRRPRRLTRRRVAERSFAWLGASRRVHTRYAVHHHPDDGFVALACALIAVARL